MSKRIVTFRLAPDLLQAVDDAAAQSGVSRSALLAHWLRDRATAEGRLDPTPQES